MPFKLRLKKSRQYNVVSKSLFVICVELLDSNSIECTLSAESSGQECLDSVCQRLGLQQPEFFGLRYISRHGPPHLRWVEMDRPIKKQLDKHAREPNLHLRVMYYVHGISLLQDETTRYHYFLQLKMDINEDRMSCDPKQAVLLASYSMQAEFGHHDPERHTAEYLKDFNLFPKHLMEQGHVESLTDAVICQHAALAGLPQSTAEEYYILAAQQLDGYGQETFVAKDETGSEVIIGVSLSGIFVGYDNPTVRMTKFYRWKDITNVINHKRVFGIECQVAEETVSFQFPDPEAAKYVWRMCVHQHTFYMQNEQATELGNNVGEQMTAALLQHNLEDGLCDSREELSGPNEWADALARGPFSSCVDLSTPMPRETDRLRALLPSYRAAPDYETAVRRKLTAAPHHQQQVGLLYGSQPEIHRPRLEQFPDVTQSGQLYGRHEPDLRQHTYSTPDLDNLQAHVIQGLQLLQLYKPPPPYPSPRPSTSTPDLGGVGGPGGGVRVTGSSPDLVSSRSLGLAVAARNRRYLDVGPGYLEHAAPTHDAAHRTYTNLAVPEPDHGFPHLRRAFSTEDPTGALYCAAPDGLALDVRQRAATVPYHGVAPEPIYENVPLPWAAERTAGTPSADPPGRSRASSIQSAPEMSRRAAAEGVANGAVGQSPPSVLPNGSLPGQSQSSLAANGSLHGQSQTERFRPPHDLSSYSLPLSVRTDESTDITQTSADTTGSSATDKKPKRRWNLLGGKRKAKGSKGDTLPRKGAGDDAATDAQHRWSIGLPRGPPTSTISKEAMCQLLEKKLADSQLFFEFEKIPKKKTDPDLMTASLPEHAVFNRFPEVLPYEESRVRVTPSKGNPRGYVNASHVTATVGASQRHYVAAQGPAPATVAAFWQAVWDADVYLVVALTGEHEPGVTPYCPGRTDRCLEIGEFQVWRQFSQESGHCVTTKLRLYHAALRRIRGVWHLRYTEWGDHGCPNNVGHFLGFLEEISSVRQHTVDEIPLGLNRNPPVLVHCQSGAGRTGVTILCDLLLAALDHNQELDVPRTTALLRQQRMLLVRTVAQYRFVYTLLIYYLKHSRLI